MFLFFIIFFKNSAYSQNKEYYINNIIEEFSQESEDELNIEELIDDLNFFYEKPLNLNIASREDLIKFKIINELQIYNLRKYVFENRQILTIYELRLIDTWNEKLINKILPFIKTEKIKKENFNLKDIISYGRHKIFLKSEKTLEEKNGYLNSSYLGNDFKLYTRYSFNFGSKVLAGFTAEKDAGEEFFKGTQKQGFDFYSAHFQIKNFHFLKNLAIGDYSLEFGQGLNLWTGYSMGKSDFNVLNVKKYPRKIKKYSSVNENKFMRGIALNFEVKNFEISGFFSRKKIDANILKTNEENDEITISSYLNTGFHRTKNEIEDKNSINETLFGTNISYKKEKIQTSISFSKYFFDANLKKQIYPYNKYELNKNNNSNLSLDAQYIFKNSLTFSEFAISENFGKSYLFGFLSYLTNNVAFSFLHRNYQKNYQNLYSNAFGENTKNANEKATYFAVEIEPFYRWKISAYYDFLKFNWLKFNANSPNFANIYFVKINYNASRNFKIYLHFKEKINFENLILEDENTKKIFEKRLKKIRINSEYFFEIGKLNLILKNRVEFSKYKFFENNENGYLTYQDINLKFKDLPFSLKFRYAIFDTESYNSRIYAYENEILYNFFIPAFYKKGRRIYLILKSKLHKNFTFEIKYGQTFYENKNSIGSSSEEIKSRTKNDIKFQLIGKF